MTLDDREFDTAVRRAMRKFDLTVDEVREDERSYLLSNDDCILDIWPVSDRVYAVCASLASSSMIRKDYHMDPYRFYVAMSKRLPFFSMKLDKEGIVYSVLTDSSGDMVDDISECILVSKMFYGLFDDVVRDVKSKS